MSAPPDPSDVLDRLAAILKRSGSGLDRVVKLNVYIARPEIEAEGL